MGVRDFGFGLAAGSPQFRVSEANDYPVAQFCPFSKKAFRDWQKDIATSKRIVAFFAEICAVWILPAK